jgi:hypothetical protein
MKLPLMNYVSLKNYYHTIDAGELLLALMVRVEKLSSRNYRLCIVRKILLRNYHQRISHH